VASRCDELRPLAFAAAANSIASWQRMLLTIVATRAWRAVLKDWSGPGTPVRDIWKQPLTRDFVLVIRCRPRSDAGDIGDVKF
jgi:hypothetical protein